MAVTFSGSSNYFSVPDHADFTLPDGDWTWVYIIRPTSFATAVDITGTGGWGAANDFMMYLGTDGETGFNIVPATDIFSPALSTNEWVILAVRRLSGTLSCRKAVMGSSTVTTNNSTSISGSWNSEKGPRFGDHADGSSNLYAGGMSDAFFVSGTGLSDTDIGNIATGTALDSHGWWSNVKYHLVCFVSESTKLDSTGTHTTTRTGTMSSLADPTQLVRFGALSAEIGLATETDLSQSIPGSVKEKDIGLVSETDTALGSQESKLKAIGFPTETDEAFAASSTTSLTTIIELVSETDSAQNITGERTVPIGLNTETDTAQIATRVKSHELGLVTETDEPQTMSSFGSINEAFETDQAFKVTTHNIIDQAIETDTAFPVFIPKTIEVGIAVETDLAQIVNPVGSVTIGQALETDVAFAAINGGKAKSIGLLTETDISLTIIVPKIRNLNTALESDSSNALTALRLADVINDRDVLLQNASTRLLPVTLPPSVTVSGPVTGSLDGASGSFGGSVTGSLVNAIGTYFGDAGGTFGGTSLPNIRNSSVTLSSSGSLQGAGGGSITSLPYSSTTGGPPTNADVTKQILESAATTIAINSGSLFQIFGSGAAGVFIGAGGLFGRNTGGSTTFSIDSGSGVANYFGDIQGGSNVNVFGQGIFNGSFSAGGVNTALSGNASFSANYGVIGFTNGGGAGVFGSGSGSAPGVEGTNNSGSGVRGNNFGGGVGVECQGRLIVTSSSIVNNLWAARSSTTDFVSASNVSGTVASAVNCSNATNASNAGALGGVDDSGWCRGIATNSGTAVASGFGFGLSTTGTLASSVRVRASGNNCFIENISDRRLKTEIRDEELGLDFVNKLRPRTYKWKEGQDTESIFHHFIAQEVLEHLEKDNDGLVIENSDGTLGVGNMVSIVVKAVQELSNKLDIVDSKIKELDSLILAVKNKENKGL